MEYKFRGINGELMCRIDLQLQRTNG
jgi:hypothetical protein